MSRPHPKSLSRSRGTSKAEQQVFRFLLAGLCLFAATLIVLAAGLPDKARVNAIGLLDNTPIAPEIGGVAPSLDGFHTDGTLLVIKPGQPIIINFWATWCGPCITELPALQTAYESNRARGLQVVAVNMGEATEAVAAWQQAFGLSFDVLIDPQRRLFDRYRVRGAPSTYFVDRRGIIRHITYGPLSEGELRAAIAELTE